LCWIVHLNFLFVIHFVFTFQFEFLVNAPTNYVWLMFNREGVGEIQIHEHYTTIYMPLPIYWNKYILVNKQFVSSLLWFKCIKILMSILLHKNYYYKSTKHQSSKCACHKNIFISIYLKTNMQLAKKCNYNVLVIIWQRTCIFSNTEILHKGRQAQMFLRKHF
jgi:hypothetical protein